MKPAFNMREALLGAVPSLRAFGISLTGDVDRADDLVQDTLLRALANVDRFEPGTNLNAWLFTILRNLFHSEYRKRRREVEDADGSYAATLRTAPDQQAHLDFEDLRTALARLPQDQREAVLLVGAQGFSYEDAANICGCAVGTIKSRVNRARKRLAELMHLVDADDLGTDGLTAAALQFYAGESGAGATDRALSRPVAAASRRLALSGAPSRRSGPARTGAGCGSWRRRRR